MKRVLLLILTIFLAVNSFGQSSEMQIIMKYVVANSDNASMYQEMSLDSPILVLHTMPEPEEDYGDFVGIELRWERAGSYTAESSVIHPKVLPVVCEMKDWYQLNICVVRFYILESTLMA